MLKYIQCMLSLLLGLISAKSDFVDKKIYNKNILIFIIISLICYLIFFKQGEEYLFSSIINLLITVTISFCFFLFKIWAAGDAKLFIATILIIPYEVYETSFKHVFPALNLLIIIFSVAFFYVVLETIYLWIMDPKKLDKVFITKISKNELYNYVLSYFMGYFFITVVNNIINNFFNDFASNNMGLLLIFNMLSLMFLYNVIQSKNKMLFTTAIFAILDLIYHILYGFTFAINIKLLLIVFIIMIFRRISEEYNYEEIKIDDLKERMILSYGSVLKFYSSNIKGLPLVTTETTDSRLTKEQVNSIKRWSKTKKGTNTIVIVRHLPFAPFIFIGEIIFFLLKCW